MDYGFGMNSKIYIITVERQWSILFIDWITNGYNDFLEEESFEHVMQAYSCYLFWIIKKLHDTQYLIRVKQDIIQGYHLDGIDTDALFQLWDELLPSIKGILQTIQAKQTIRNIEPIIEHYTLKGFIIHVY